MHTISRKIEFDAGFEVRLQVEPHNFTGGPDRNQPKPKWLGREIASAAFRSLVDNQVKWAKNSRVSRQIFVKLDESFASATLTGVSGKGGLTNKYTGL
jgi:hypothetical protein